MRIHRRLMTVSCEHIRFKLRNAPQHETKKGIMIAVYCVLTVERMTSNCAPIQVAVGCLSYQGVSSLFILPNRPLIHVERVSGVQTRTVFAVHVIFLEALLHNGTSTFSWKIPWITDVTSVYRPLNLSNFSMTWM